jgi:hypothetical protein
MAELVYLLCAAASVTCAGLLWNGYRRSRTALLLWSSLCFAGLAADSLLIVVDLILVPELDLSIARALVALVSMVALLYGLITQME